MPWYRGAALIDRLDAIELRRADNLHLQHIEVERSARARIKGQRPCVLWFTGLPV